MYPLMYFGTIEYDDMTQESYRYIKISDRKSGFEKIFDAGCPIIDYINLLHFLVEQDAGIRWSSSYDHFLMDGDTYCSRAVSCKNSEDPEDHEFVDWRVEPYNFEIMTKSEFKSFQEHRKYYKDWKSKQENFQI